MSIESQYCEVCDQNCKEGGGCPVSEGDIDTLEYLDELLAKKNTMDADPLYYPPIQNTNNMSVGSNMDPFEDEDEEDFA